MLYRKSTKEDASLNTPEKIFFLIGIVSFAAVLLLLRPIKDLNRFLPSILVGITGLLSVGLAALIIVRHRRDKEDEIVRGFQPIVFLAYISLAVVSFFLLFLILLLFFTVVRHGELNK